MAKIALYQKYRSATFEEVVGQEYIVRSIKNAVQNHKVGHAYLFCGPRGTGKTTMARLLAIVYLLVRSMLYIKRTDYFSSFLSISLIIACTSLFN